MTKKGVVALLKKNLNERGIAEWKKRGGIGDLKTFGLGLVQLKGLAKRVGRNHELALELWDSDVYDVKLLATMIDDPRQIDREQVEKQVDELVHWRFSHAYTTNLLPGVDFLRELTDEWTNNKDDHIRRRCGYLCLSLLARNDKKLEDEYFEAYLDTIKENLPSEEDFVKDAMNKALLMIGQRNRNLNTQALSAARKVGPVEVDYGNDEFEPIDVVAYLSSEQVQRQVMQAVR